MSTQRITIGLLLGAAGALTSSTSFAQTVADCSPDAILAAATGARRDLLERALVYWGWAPNYSQTACLNIDTGDVTGIPGGGCPAPTLWRTDCSGFVSYVWDLDHSYVTYTLQSGGTDANGKTWVAKGWADLQPGDAVNWDGPGNEGHVRLFTGWLDAAKTKYCVLAESQPGATDPWGGWGCIAHSTTVANDQATGYVPIGLTDIPDSLSDVVLLPLAVTYELSVSSDIDGDGISDLCGRHSGGFACARSSQDGFGEAVTSIPLSNDAGWSFPEYYGTIRMGDIDGDRRDDVCARGADGVACWLSDGKSFPDMVTGPEWSDAGGWNNIGYWSTIRLADIDGDGMDDICGRSAAGLECHISTGNGFGPAIAGPEMSDAYGWGDEMYFATIRFADVNADGKADVCARHSLGFSCWLSDGEGFPTQIEGPAMSNENGWADRAYWPTIRMADVDGNGMADVCARHAYGFSCWLADGAGFPTQIDGPAMSNENGWGKPEYDTTIRMADIDGDAKADLCARGGTGFACWLSLGNGFGEAITGPDMSDAQGWAKVEYFSTFRVTNAMGDGRAQVCGRGGAGVVCFPFDGKAFGDAISGPEWSDANGWAEAMYFGTLQMAGGSILPPPPPPLGGSSSSSAAGGGVTVPDDPTVGDDSVQAPSCACRTAPGGSDTRGSLFVVLCAAMGALSWRRQRRRGNAVRRG